MFSGQNKTKIRIHTHKTGCLAKENSQILSFEKETKNIWEEKPEMQDETKYREIFHFPPFLI